MYLHACIGSQTALPLPALLLQDMDDWGWEIIVLLDGYDESTSQPVQAGGRG